jgi:hypothetical protein
LETIDDFVFWQRRWFCSKGVPEFYRVGDDLTLRVTFYQFETPVRFEGWADIEPVFGPVIP